MIVNYAQLIADDPGGDLSSAFAIMSSATIDKPVDIRINDITLASKIGLVKTMQFQSALKAAVAAGDLPTDVLDWFDGKGIELNNSDSLVVLNNLVLLGHLSQPLHDEIVALRMAQQPKYPGLKMGHLQNARQIADGTYDKRGS